MNDGPTPSNGGDTAVGRKIKSIEELGTLAEEIREDGRTVALCHGVFDLVHMGHIRHLQAGKDEADALMVTLTADHFVNKGPGRPIFPEHMRAEMIAAIEFVDYVGINYQSSSENVLNTIKPSVYVKGSDYENPEDDLTGKITKEREAVENHGGRLIFTKDITFSSSALINKYLDVYDPPLRDFLEGFRAERTIDDLLGRLETLTDMRVLLVGDTIIDEYQYVDALGKSAKENMIATRHKGRELFAGGIIATANHIANYCAEVEIITSLGNLDSHEELIRESLKPNVKLTPLHRDGVPTTRKCRFVEASYMRKLFEVYYFDDSPPKKAFDDAVIGLVRERAPQYDVVIASDFGHGMNTPGVIEALAEKSKFLAVNAQTNAGNQGFNLVTKYPKADFVCIDGTEARLAVHDKFADLAVIAGEKLPAVMDCSKFIVTGGVHGCITYDRATEVSRIPVFTKQVVDTVGAGDAFLAITAPLVASGCDMKTAGFIGNAVGALKVGIVGHRKSVEKVPLTKFLTTLMK